MSEVSEVIEEREGTHGPFERGAAVAQELKFLIKQCLRPNNSLEAVHKEALDQICSKLSRILAGNENEPDHWKDIAGYATLVERHVISKISE